MPTAGASQNLGVTFAGILEVSWTPGNFGSSVADFHVAEAMETPRASHSDLSQGPPFPGPAEGFSVFTGHMRRWGEGIIFAQQLPFHIIRWKSQDGEGSFCLDVEKFLFCLRYDLGTSFQIPGTEPCTPEP